LSPSRQEEGREEEGEKNAASALAVTGPPPRRKKKKGASSILTFSHEGGGKGSLYFKMLRKEKGFLSHMPQRKGGRRTLLRPHSSYGEDVRVKEGRALLSCTGGRWIGSGPRGSAHQFEGRKDDLRLFFSKRHFGGRKNAWPLIQIRYERGEEVRRRLLYNPMQFD